jgi:RNA polymerase sigma factor (sigma-70 family)
MTLGQAFESVITAARAGAEWAWTELYDDLAPLVFGYLRGRGAVEPEDLTGEVFLQMVRDIGSFEGDERDFRSWTLSIAHHRLLDDIRYRKRRPAEPGGEGVEQHLLLGGDVESEALSSLGSERVLRIMQGLAPDQRDVLLLRMLADLTIEEIAKILDKRVGAVKALQRRGLANLRKRIPRERTPASDKDANDSDGKEKTKRRSDRAGPQGSIQRGRSRPG